MWVGVFFLRKKFLHFPKEYEGGLDVQTCKRVPHNNDDLYGGAVFFFREGAPLVGLHIGLVRWMK